jgi:hypothetical protein
MVRNINKKYRQQEAFFDIKKKDTISNNPASYNEYTKLMNKVDLKMEEMMNDEINNNNEDIVVNTSKTKRKRNK